MRFSVLTKTLLISAGLFVLLILVGIVSVFVGTSFVDFRKILEYGLYSSESSQAVTIIFSYRLPRTLLAAVAGGGLASAGVVFQGVLRNPLADPYIVGIAAGGALGAVISIVMIGEGSLIGTSLAAFVGSLVAVSVVYGLASLKRGAQYTNTVILAGVIVGALMNSIMLLFMSVSGSDEVQRILFWLLGDFSLADYSRLALGSVFVLIGWLAIYLHANSLNVLIAGDRAAIGLGLNVTMVRTYMMAVAALITGAVVSVAGTVGFVGLVVPHAMRLMFGPDNRILLPASLLGGAAFLAGADCLARIVAYPVELPVGVITAMAGAPFFLYLLVRR
jgi:iron complex transport system permease protein